MGFFSDLFKAAVTGQASTKKPLVNDSLPRNWLIYFYRDSQAVRANIYCDKRYCRGVSYSSAEVYAKQICKTFKYYDYEITFE